MRRTRYDCIVVGGRVAGASSALLLARRGLRVLVLDSGTLGSDTLSTHFVWPRGARRLQEWGILGSLVQRSTPPIGRISFDPGCVVVSAELELEAWCPRRTVLDRVLVEAALEAGVDFRHQTGVGDLLEEDGRVVGVRHRDGIERAPVVVGADGRGSMVARQVGAEILAALPPQTAGYYAYFDRLPVDGAEFHVRGGRLTYAWPTNDGLTCVYVAVAAGEFDGLREQLRGGFTAAAVDDPSLLQRLRGARQVSRSHGFAAQGPARRRRSGPGWVLIGDAASFKDPAAGMGISEAFDDAAWLDEEASRGWLDAPDSSARDTASARIFNFCAGVADLRPPEPWLTEAYREASADRRWSRELMRMLGGEVTAADFFGALARREAPC